MITVTRESAVSVNVSCKGPVWLHNVGCSSDDEILDDCDIDRWGASRYYCSHYDDVGVICQPGKLR